MATRSFIGLLKEDSSIEGIYCHFDGNPENHIPLLNNYYKSLDKIKELISLGPISELAPEIGEKHSFYSPHPGWVVAYGRDRGEIEDVSKTFTYSSVEEMKERYQSDLYAQYAYIYQNNKWEVY